jgi:hypothetical protein
VAGKIFLETEINYEKGNSRLLKSSRAMDLHNDHQGARYIAWQCLSQSAFGGESLLLDAHNVLASFTEEELLCLEKVMVISHAVMDGDRYLYPLLKRRGGHTQVFYAPWMLMEMKSYKEDAAVSKFKQLIARSQTIEIKLSEGDWLIIDNHRMLHGRKGFEPDAGRLLKRYWIKEK